ncbi:MAG: DUF4431 domain-containing protein [Hyphomicrobiales bacterium]|nr:DUF4431 domain-containing protein [Hyphomicrobiales bacterium]MDE2286238.1 DUF4431 domain-containing protein [Hyphomicrobiales bacterium]
MRLIPVSLIFLIISIGYCSAQPTAVDACVDLKRSERIRFEGVLTHKVFPGAPNYQDVRKGDKPEPAYILHLPKPICVAGDAFIGPDKQIDRIQIFPAYQADDRPLWAALRASVGKSVVVEGTEPFGAHTGHHHAPLLLPATKITVATGRAPK